MCVALHPAEGVVTVMLRLTVILEPAEEGGFIVKCVELPVASQGETRAGALANIKEAIEGYLEVKAEQLKERTRGEKVEVIVETPSPRLA
ncbi:MAG: type II toxin-antitoxin system HicB family antitoxin [Candidatus Bathyarchaeia archaeon]